MHEQSKIEKIEKNYNFKIENYYIQIKITIKPVEINDIDIGIFLTNKRTTCEALNKKLRSVKIR